MRILLVAEGKEERKEKKVSIRLLKCSVATMSQFAHAGYHDSRDGTFHVLRAPILVMHNVLCKGRRANLSRVTPKGKSSSQPAGTPTRACLGLMLWLESFWDLCRGLATTRTTTTTCMVNQTPYVVYSVISHISKRGRGPQEATSSGSGNPIVPHTALDLGRDLGAP